MSEPENLAQETIIENLNPKEAARLARVRNIGIAVRSSHMISSLRAGLRKVGTHRQR